MGIGNTELMSTLMTLAKEEPALVKQAPHNKNQYAPFAQSLFTSTPEGRCPFAPSTFLQLNEVRKTL